MRAELADCLQNAANYPKQTTTVAMPLRGMALTHPRLRAPKRVKTRSRSLSLTMIGPNGLTK